MSSASTDGALRLRPSTDDAVWDDLVARHPNGTAFHLSRFLRTAGPLLGLRVRLAVAESDGETVGVVPMLLRAVGPFLLVNHWLPFPHLGPLLPPEFTPDAVVSSVRSHLRPRPVAHFGVQSTTPFPVPDRRGWECREDFCSAVVPTGGKDDDALLALLSRGQRQVVRRAVKDGLVSEPATREDITVLTGWSRATLLRQGVSSPWPSDSHLALHDALAPSGVCLATAVRRDDELLAVSLDMLFGDRLVGWEMGMSEEGRAAGASLVLHTAVMRRARDLGATELDMLGAPTPSIASYKRSLGAELRPRGVAVWAPHWLPPRKYLRRVATLLPSIKAP